MPPGSQLIIARKNWLRMAGLMLLVKESVEPDATLVWTETQLCKFVEICNTLVAPGARLIKVICSAPFLTVRFVKSGAGGAVTAPERE